MVIDFESDRNGTWTCFAAVVICWSSQKLLQYVQIGHSTKGVPEPAGPTEEQKEFDADLLAFWKRHPDAQQYNAKLCARHTKPEAEKIITEFVKGVKSSWPNFYLLTDNPSLDVRLLDNILLQNGSTPVSYRTKATGKYRQPVCLWSFGRSLPAYIQKNCLKPFVEAGTERAISQLQLAGSVGPRHTPLFDAISALVTFRLLFEALENANQKKKR